MPKNSRKQIDEDEKKILHELQGNGKGSIDAVAKKCGFSRQKVWRIIKRLENNKTIWGYCAVADDEKIDVTHYTMLVKRTIVPIGEKLKDMISKEELDGYFPELNITLEDCLYVNGNYDWIISFTAPGIREMKIFCEKLLHKFSEHVESYEILETIITIEKQGIKNPSIDEQSILL
jgi:DNA-binding Lrp family transcriptional regulator